MQRPFFRVLHVDFGGDLRGIPFTMGAFLGGLA